MGYEELCRLKWVLLAEVDNTLQGLHNFLYPTKDEFIDCFIIHSKYLFKNKLKHAYLCRCQVHINSACLEY